MTNILIQAKSICKTFHTLGEGVNVIKKWTQRYKNWGLTLNQLTIFFEGRIEPHL